MSRSTLETFPFSTSNVQTASICNLSGGVPPWSRTFESSIAKHEAWAAAMSSSGLVLPSERSVREAQVTGNSPIAPLPTVNLPPPRVRLPSQTTSARRSAIVMSFLLLARPCYQSAGPPPHLAKSGEDEGLLSALNTSLTRLV